MSKGKSNLMTTLRPRVRARLDPTLHAELDQVIPLVYTDGPSPQSDLPAHVRAASAIRRLGRHIVIVQDDVNAVAICDMEDRYIYPMLLPPGPGGRRVFDDVAGNKHQKLDLEAAARLPDDRLVAFGSGASAAREKVVVVSKREPPSLRDGAALYRALRAEPAFCGSELNIEGAVVLGDQLLLLQRGNAAVRGTRKAVNALGALELESFVRWLDGLGPVPPLSAITPFDLGDIGGTALGFTDAAVTTDGRIAILACAEDSPDALTDGPVRGCRFGYFDPDADLRVTDVLEAGVRTQLKLEGIESRPGEPRRFDVVADRDLPLQPALIGRLTVRE
jgi:hypothetical protein